MQSDKQLIETALGQALSGLDRVYTAPVCEAMEYSLTAGGKRIRPLLTLAFAALCGGKKEEALPFACAVEMVHTYSLIHDDLPCMDNDTMRRGKPTNHVVYGEDIALLAGDGLLTLAFETLLAGTLPPERKVQAAGILSRYAGVAGMVGGQCIDLKSEGRRIDLEELKAMDMGKTVALITAACLLGVTAAGGTGGALAAAAAYAEGVGMAFQIRDDILDVVGDPAKLGKNTGMDSRLQKCNYVTLLGLEKAQALVDEYTAQAISALAAFDGDTAWLAGFAKEMAGRAA